MNIIYIFLLIEENLELISSLNMIKDEISDWLTVNIFHLKTLSKIMFSRYSLVPYIEIRNYLLAFFIEQI
jgi:hypothetical protein